MYIQPLNALYQNIAFFSELNGGLFVDKLNKIFIAMIKLFKGN